MIFGFTVETCFLASPFGTRCPKEKVDKQKLFSPFFVSKKKRSLIGCVFVAATLDRRLGEVLIVPCCGSSMKRGYCSCVGLFTIDHWAFFYGLFHEVYQKTIAAA